MTWIDPKSNAILLYFDLRNADNCRVNLYQVNRLLSSNKIMIQAEQSALLHAIKKKNLK